MKIKLEGDTPQILSRQGETIIVQVEAQGTKRLVTYGLASESYSINEASHKKLELALRRGRGGSDQLIMSLGFSNPEGGKYRIHIIGESGETYTRIFEQSPSQFQITCAFDLGGDETKDGY